MLVSASLKMLVSGTKIGKQFTENAKNRNFKLTKILIRIQNVFDFVFENFDFCI